MSNGVPVDLGPRPAAVGRELGERARGRARQRAAAAAISARRAMTSPTRSLKRRSSSAERAVGGTGNAAFELAEFDGGEAHRSAIVWRWMKWLCRRRSFDQPLALLADTSM